MQMNHVNSFELPQDYFETGNLKNSKEICYNLRQHTNHNLYTERRLSMKRNRTTAIVFYIIAVVFYIVAAINIFDKATRGMGVTWLCLGSTWLCLGTVYFLKS